MVGHAHVEQVRVDAVVDRAERVRVGELDQGLDVGRGDGGAEGQGDGEKEWGWMDGGMGEEEEKGGSAMSERSKGVRGSGLTKKSAQMHLGLWLAARARCRNRTRRTLPLAVAVGRVRSPSDPSSPLGRLGQPVLHPRWSSLTQSCAPAQRPRLCARSFPLLFVPDPTPSLTQPRTLLLAVPLSDMSARPCVGSCHRLNAARRGARGPPTRGSLP